MKIGVSQDDIRLIIDVIKQFPEVQSAMIFGYRAMGNCKRGSDIDIALIGKDVNFSTISKV